MVSEPPLKSSQEDVDHVWGKVWEEARIPTRKELFGHRLFVEGYKVFRTHLPVASGLKVLDVGSGSGRYGIRFAEEHPSWQVYLTDITESSLRIMKETARIIGVNNTTVQKEDMFALSFPDDMFDVVFCDVVIQHVDSPERAIKEMLRVLRPGGTLIVSTVNRWNFHSAVKATLKFFGKPYIYGYEKSYSIPQLEALVRGCGASVRAMDDFYPAYGIYRLKDKNKLFGVIGRVLNRATALLDKITNRSVSRWVGFEVFCVASK